jgi:hypothetical protein
MQENFSQAGRTIGYKVTTQINYSAFVRGSGRVHYVKCHRVSAPRHLAKMGYHH